MDRRAWWATVHEVARVRHRVLVSGASGSAGDHPLGAGKNWAPSWKAWTYTPPTPIYIWETLASLVAQTVKNLPAVQETRV